MITHSPIRVLAFSLVLFLGFARQAYCEDRAIGIRIEMKEGQPVVSMYSDVKQERLQKVSVNEAAEVLKKAEGWGSVVRVLIAVDTRDQASAVPLRHYLPLIKTISENRWLHLIGLEIGGDPARVKDQIKKWMDETK